MVLLDGFRIQLLFSFLSLLQHNDFKNALEKHRAREARLKVSAVVQCSDPWPLTLLCIVSMQHTPKRALFLQARAERRALRQEQARKTAEAQVRRLAPRTHSHLLTRFVR